MSVTRKFWRLFETAVLAYTLHYLIVWLFFVLPFLPRLLARFFANPGGPLPEVPIYVWLFIFVAALPLLSLSLTVVAPTKASRAICPLSTISQRRSARGDQNSMWLA
jgi:hypothetical protein